MLLGAAAIGGIALGAHGQITWNSETTDALEQRNQAVSTLKELGRSGANTSSPKANEARREYIDSSNQIGILYGERMEISLRQLKATGTVAESLIGVGGIYLAWSLAKPAFRRKNNNQ